MHILRTIRYISPTKIFNFCRLCLVYVKLLIGRKCKSLPQPFFASFEPTDICNLSCKMCPSGQKQLKRQRGFANLQTYKKFIDENCKFMTTIILHFQGEPLMHTQLAEMIAYAHEKNVYTMLSTNGQLLAKYALDISAAGLDKIVVSLDGLTDETYCKYRNGGNVKNVITGLERLSELPRKNRPYIELQVLVFSHNEHELSAFKTLKKRFKIDKIVFKTAQIYEKSQVDFLPNNKHYSRYLLDKNGNIALKKPIRNKCKRLIFGSVVCYDGAVVPCCFDKDADYNFGNINDNQLSDIRNTKAYCNFVEKVFTNRKSLNICNNCTE